jgi:hypothetical protein
VMYVGCVYWVAVDAESCCLWVLLGLLLLLFVFSGGRF